MNIGYAGLNSQGVEVMGLGIIDETSNMIVPDKQLVWNVPMKWSIEDAVTIPIAYSMVNLLLLCALVIL